MNMHSSPCKINANYKVYQTAEPMAKSLRPRSFQNLSYGLILSRYFPDNQHLQTLKKSKRNLLVVVYSSVQPGHVPPPPPPGPPSSSSWKSWLLALAFTVVIPFVANKWGPLLKLIKGEVETAVETAEEVVSTVEKVSEKVEEVAEKIADELPEGGKLRSVVVSVEKMAETADKDAHLAADFVAKVEKTEVKVQSAMDSVINKPKEAKDHK